MPPCLEMPSVWPSKITMKLQDNMKRETVDGVACPFCGTPANEKTLKRLKCENCQLDLRTPIYKNMRGELLVRTYQVIGKIK